MDENFSTSVEMTGVEEIQSAFRTLQIDVQKRILKKALKESGAPVMRRAISLLGRMTITRTGNLIRSIVTIEKLLLD